MAPCRLQWCWNFRPDQIASLEAVVPFLPGSIAAWEPSIIHISATILAASDCLNKYDSSMPGFHPGKITYAKRIQRMGLGQAEPFAVPAGSACSTFFVVTGNSGTP